MTSMIKLDELHEAKLAVEEQRRDAINKLRETIRTLVEKLPERDLKNLAIYTLSQFVGANLDVRYFAKSKEIWLDQLIHSVEKQSN